MLRCLLLALALLLPSAALAQASDPAADQAYTQRLTRLRNIVVEAVHLTPSVKFITKDEDQVAVLQKAAEAARNNGLSLRALVLEVEAMPRLQSRNDPTRDEAIGVFQEEVHRILVEIGAGLAKDQTPPSDDPDKQRDQYFDAYGLEVDVIRESAVNFALSCALDLAPSAGHDACRAFIHLTNARIALQRAKEGSSVDELRAKLADAVAGLKDVKARGNARPWPSPTFDRALGAAIGVVEMGATGDIWEETVEETTAMALMIQLYQATRGVLVFAGT